MKKNLVVWMDCGDTLVDESTQVFDETGVVLSAQPIPGAVELLHTLREQGYRLALVADGKTRSFENILHQLDLTHLFEVLVISQEVGCTKPCAAMFETAMARLDLGEWDRSRIVMVGNNLERDIAGANAMGLTSVLLTYSPRYRMQPNDPCEIPDYVIALPSQLPLLLEHLELQVCHRDAAADVGRSAPFGKE